MSKPPLDVRKFDILYSPQGLVKGEPLALEPDGFLPMQPYRTAGNSNEYKAVWNYLKRRTGDIYLMEKYFGYVPGTHRAWILIDENWWQGRLLVPGEPKYINPPWPKGDSLWNAEALKCNHVVICEGVFSAIAVGDNAIALCGKAANDNQLERIVNARPEYIMIMLDADALDYSYEMGNQLKYLGYEGTIQVQEMMRGDPADGIFGKLVPWTWDKVVSNKLSLNIVGKYN